MISPIFDQNIFKILSVFSLSLGSRFNRKDLKDKTKLNNIPLDVSLGKLVTTSVLEKQGNFYSVNFEKDESKRLIEIIGKQYKQLKEIPLDIYFILVDVSYNISHIRGVEAHLFGSYSKLVYKEGSDVDIAILTTKFKKDVFEKQIAKIKKLYKKNVEIHYFDKNLFYKNKKDPLVLEILKNGSRLV